LDLDELGRITKQRDAEQRGRRSRRRERGLHDPPDADEVVTFARDDVDGRLQEILRSRSGGRQRSEQIRDGNTCLLLVVAGSHDSSVRIERTCAGSEDGAPRRSDRGVLVRHVRVEGVARHERGLRGGHSAYLHGFALVTNGSSWSMPARRAWSSAWSGLGARSKRATACALDLSTSSAWRETSWTAVCRA